MTREEALQVLIIKANKGAFVEDIINQIFDEHEKELKQAYIDGSNSNNGLIKFYLKQIEDKDKEIERLESRVYALENDTIVQNMEQRLIDISLVINGELTSKDNA